MENINVDIRIDSTEISDLEMIKKFHDDLPFFLEFGGVEWNKGYYQLVPLKKSDGPVTREHFEGYQQVIVAQSNDNVSREIVAQSDLIIVPVPSNIRLLTVSVNPLCSAELHKNEPGYLFGQIMSEQVFNQLKVGSAA